MLDVLRDIPAQRHIAVLGEMLELGRWSEPLHRDVGNYAVRCGIAVLVGIRGGARSMVEAATEAGLAKNAAYFFEDPAEAGVRLRSLVQAGGCHTVQRLARNARGARPWRNSSSSPVCSTGSSISSSSWATPKQYPFLSPLRLFYYSTFRIAFASLTALFLCIIIGPWLIRKLREFQIGQHIREDGPKSHQKKAGTPTMGGVLIIISIVVPTLLWTDLRNPYVWVALFGLLSFGAIGFYDDYTKVRKMQNLGLTAQEEVRAAGLGFAVGRLAAARAACAGSLRHCDERSVLQTVQARIC